MTSPPAEVETLIRDAYAAFNRRDVDAALAVMTEDVEWPNGWEGGWVHGHGQVRSYWARQWAELDPTVTPRAMTVTHDGRVDVAVDQQVRTPDGEVIWAGAVHHVYTLRDGRVSRMEIAELSP